MSFRLAAIASIKIWATELLEFFKTKILEKNAEFIAGAKALPNTFLHLRLLFECLAEIPKKIQ